MLQLTFAVTINKNWQKETEAKMRVAAMKAAKQVAADTKAKARAMIGKSWPGMQGRMQNALRVEIYPKNKQSWHPLMEVRHNAAYSKVFEEGATIGAPHLLWMPLPAAKKLMPINRSGMSPKSAHYVRDIIGILRAKKGEAIYVKGRGGRPPLICASYDVSHKGKIRKNYTKKGFITHAQLTPLFFGVPSVKIQGKWRIKELVASEWGRMPNLIHAALRSGD